ncbi:MAG: extracellular solute-binding protein, partial [Phycisphaerales bacterium]|nr:extracellular solute-binding protein [Phycisphaerales bacterium]
KVSMLVQGPWLVNNIRAYRPDLEFGAAPFPVISSIYDPNAPRALAECDILVIPKGCPHPEEAWEFFKYTQTHAVQEALSGAHCKPSGLRTCSAEFLASHDNPYVGMHDDMLKSPGVYIWPQVPSWLFLSEETVKLQDRIWDTPDQTGAHVALAASRMRGEHARQVEGQHRQERARG